MGFAKSHRTFLFISAALACLLFVANCQLRAQLPDSEHGGPLVDVKFNPLVTPGDMALRQQLRGRWQTLVGNQSLELNLSDDNKFEMGTLAGQYAVSGSELIISGDNIETAGYLIALDKNSLTLSGGGLKTPMKFTRITKPAQTVSWLFDISWASLRIKLYRILVIMGVILACRVIIAVLRALSHFIIYSQVGPLKWLYRYRKNRAMTIHMLTLNIVKYVIYLLAVGFILTEMGVNYTAYLASVSILGLSIAFGAQGLVQDMVTGLLIIIEGQFDVGDMVDIPPHTGVVEVLGLRMTKLRNYEGQQIVIPNRAISAVSNYSGGDQDASVDVCAPDEQTAQKMAEIMDSLGEQMALQYPGIIIKAPHVGDCLQIDGKFVIRVHVGFWPKQQWVVDQQLVKRIKASLAEAGIEIADGDVSVFYHDAKRVEISSLGQTLKKLGELGKRIHGRG